MNSSDESSCVCVCAIVRMYVLPSFPAVPTYPLSIALFALVNTTHARPMELVSSFCLAHDLARWRIACGDLLAINKSTSPPKKVEKRGGRGGG